MAHISSGLAFSPPSHCLPTVPTSHTQGLSLIYHVLGRARPLPSTLNKASCPRFCGQQVATWQLLSPFSPRHYVKHRAVNKGAKSLPS